MLERKGNCVVRFVRDVVSQNTRIVERVNLCETPAVTNAFVDWLIKIYNGERVRFYSV